MTLQNGSAKETVSLKFGKNIDIDFICMGIKDRIFIDINHHYEITMN